MPDPTTAPPAYPEGVRTVTSPSLVGSPCPVCHERSIRGRQTVCSGRCRARRWRLGKAALTGGRDQEIRELLESALRLLGRPDLPTQGPR